MMDRFYLRIQRTFYDDRWKAMLYQDVEFGQVEVAGAVSHSYTDAKSALLAKLTPDQRAALRASYVADLADIARAEGDVCKTAHEPDDGVARVVVVHGQPRKVWIHAVEATDPGDDLAWAKREAARIAEANVLRNALAADTLRRELEAIGETHAA